MTDTSNTNPQHFCKALPSRKTLARVYMQPVPPAEMRRLEAAILFAKQWPQNHTVRIAFLEGNSSMHQWVMQVVMEQMQPLMNLQLEFVQPGAGNTDMRITFDQNSGAWSYLGLDCLNIPQNQPTMNLGWLDYDRNGAVILHEFGHALGPWIHEHQSPRDNVIQWNKPQVIADLSGPPNNWDAATIENNMFRQYDINQIRGSSYDPESIMHYVFPTSWTLNGMSSQLRTHLSAKDKHWLAKTYPPDPLDPEPTGPEPTDPLGPDEWEPYDPNATDDTGTATATTTTTDTNIDCPTCGITTTDTDTKTTPSTGSTTDCAGDTQTIVIITAVICVLVVAGVGLMLFAAYQRKRASRASRGRGSTTSTRGTSSTSSSNPPSSSSGGGGTSRLSTTASRT